MDIKGLLRRRAGGLVARYAPYGLHAALRAAFHDCESILDLGCGTESMVHQFAAGRFVAGLDRHYPSLLHNRGQGNYAAHVQGDILDAPFGKGTFDAVVALDVLEHFTREQGLQMLALMKDMARKRVVVLTPNGFLPQPASENPWQLHRSGWTEEDFRGMGFAVHGIYGWKRLRGMYARLRCRPWLFWEGVSRLSQPFCRHHPERAFLICAVLDTGA